MFSVPPLLSCYKRKEPETQDASAVWSLQFVVDVWVLMGPMSTSV